MNFKGEIVSDSNHNIDIWKLIMAFAVVAIHAPEYLFPNDRVYPEAVKVFISLAVPYFFIVSGFFMMKKVDQGCNLICKKTYLLRRAKSLIKIYCYWLIVYLPLSLWGYLSSSDSIYNILKEYIRDVLINGGSLYAHQLWYIYSLSFISLIVALCINWKNSIEYLFVLFFCIRLACYFDGDVLYSFHNLTKRILGGGVYVTAGMLCYKYKYRINRQFLITIGGLLLLAISSFAWQIEFTNLFGGVLLFLVVERFKRLPDKINYKNIRAASMWIYYIHMYIVMSLYVLINHTDLVINRWVSLGVACLLSYLLARLLVLMSLTKRFSGINILIR